MKLDIYQIDAFTKTVFGGNPAAVVPLSEWLPDNTMQWIATENNLSETAFFVPTGTGFHIRWFTPVDEVDLCGHATLATAFVIFTELGYDAAEIGFESRSGCLKVRKQDGQFVLDFPSQPPKACVPPAALVDALGFVPSHCYQSEDYLVELDSVDAVKAITPKSDALCQLDLRGLIITAQDTDSGFVSRFFVPKLGIYEDPVTGSAHTQLTPYWAEKLGVQTLQGKQISRRGGELLCTVNGDRVEIAGQAVKYMSGTIEI